MTIIEETAQNQEAINVSVADIATDIAEDNIQFDVTPDEMDKLVEEARKCGKMPSAADLFADELIGEGKYSKLRYPPSVFDSNMDSTDNLAATSAKLFGVNTYPQWQEQYSISAHSGFSVPEPAGQKLRFLAEPNNSYDLPTEQTYKFGYKKRNSGLEWSDIKDEKVEKEEDNISRDDEGEALEIVNFNTLNEIKELVDEQKIYIESVAEQIDDVSVICKQVEDSIKVSLSDKVESLSSRLQRVEDRLDDIFTLLSAMTSSVKKS